MDRRIAWAIFLVFWLLLVFLFMSMVTQSILENRVKEGKHRYSVVVRASILKDHCLSDEQHERVDRVIEELQSPGWFTNTKTLDDQLHAIRSEYFGPEGDLASLFDMPLAQEDLMTCEEIRTVKEKGPEAMYGKIFNPVMVSL